MIGNMCPEGQAETGFDIPIEEWRPSKEAQAISKATGGRYDDNDSGAGLYVPDVW